MYQHILVSIDLSPVSEKILQHACYIAAKSHAKMSLLHVMEHSPMGYAGEFSVTINPDLEEQFEHAARLALADLGERYQVPAENQYLKQGSIKNVIKDLVTK